MPDPVSEQPAVPDEAEAEPAAMSSDQAEVPGEPTASEDTAGSPSISEYPEVVAKVRDYEITRDAYLEQLHDLRVAMFYQRNGKPPIPNVTPLPELDNTQKAMVLRSMVEARIFAVLAQERGIEVSEDEVDAKLEELTSELSSPEQLQDRLQQAGTTMDEFQDSIRQRLMMEKFGAQLIEGFEPTDAQLQQAYDQLKKKGAVAMPRSADVAHIFIEADSTDPVAIQKAKADIEAIRERIAAGEDFQEVAKEVSQDANSAPEGGVYTEVVRGQLGQGFDDRLFTMEIDTVSEPFRSLKGWHIMKVLARHDSRDRTLDEVKDGLVAMLKTARQTEAMSRAVDEAWPEADIELFIDLNLDEVPRKEVIPVPPEAVRDPSKLPITKQPADSNAENGPEPAPGPASETPAEETAEAP